MERKRHRAQNFSDTEKQLLLFLIDKYKFIIEDKRLNGSVRSQKEAIWKKLADEYNTHTSAAPRKLSTLKKWYENHKKRVRKYTVMEKNIFIPEIDMKPDNLDELTTGTVSNLAELNTMLNIDRNCNTTQPECETTPIVEESNEDSVDHDQEETDTSLDVNSAEPDNKNQDTNDSFNVSECSTSRNSMKVYKKRWRPIPKNTTIYGELAKEKIKLIKYHASILKEEVALRRAREREEFLIRQEILMTELKIKQTILLKMQYQDYQE